MQEQKNQIQAFGFGDALVRVVMIEGEMWWVAKDVCAVLGISDVGQALDRLDEDERGGCSTPTPGGVQTVAAVNESGLYSLILGSRKPEAKVFKRWVTHEVLPSIRKTGGYGVQPAADLNRKVNAIKAMQKAGALTKDQAAAEMRKLAFEMGWVETPEMPALPPEPVRYPSAAQWLRECCTIINDEAISRWTPAAVAYAHYCDWCRACGVRPLYVRHLKAVVVESGATARKSSGVFYSIALSTDRRAA